MGKSPGIPWGPHIDKIVAEGMKRAHGVIALFTADEFAHLRPECAEGKESVDLRRWQARPNVIFEGCKSRIAC